MRTPYLAANWKMHLDREAIGAFCAGLRDVAQQLGGEVRLGVFPPFVYLAEVVEALDGTDVVVGAQTGRPEASGAFTGEVALRQVRDVGARCVLVGHSERRAIFGETDDDVRARLRAALELGLEVILCVGESLQERQADRTSEVVTRHFERALLGLDGERVAERVTLAYEPVWAIGTGHTASPEQAQQVHAELRALAARHFGDGVAARLVIQYGGSVKPDNVGALLACPDVDGALVGGASLQLASFEALARLGVEGAAP